MLPTALLPGLLHQLHVVSSDPVLCATVAAVEVSADVAYSLLCPALWVSHFGRMQWQEQQRGWQVRWAPRAGVPTFSLVHAFPEPTALKLPRVTGEVTAHSFCIALSIQNISFPSEQVFPLV